MKRMLLKMMMSVAGVLAVMTMLGGMATAQSTGNLVITGTAIDAVKNVVTISRENFASADGRYIPSVFLGRDLLPQLAPASATLIYAMLPFNLAPGTYLLTVSNGTKTGHYDTFDLTIGAAGPK